MVAMPEYSNELTNASWQKKKGTIAKIATGSDGSGIGKRLEALQAAFGKIKWTNFDFDSVITVSAAKLGPEHVKQYVEVAKGELAKTLPARKLASEVETEAKKVAGEWSKSKLIPKSSAKAAQDVSNAAQKLAFSMTPGTLSDLMKENVARAEAKIAKNAAFKKQELAKITRLVDEMIADAEKLKAPGDWNGFWMQKVRAVGAAMPMAAAGSEKLKALAPKVKTFTSDQSNPEDDKALKTKIAQTKAIGNAIKAAVA